MTKLKLLGVLTPQGDLLGKAFTNAADAAFEAVVHTKRTIRRGADGSNLTWKSMKQKEGWRIVPLNVTVAE